MVLIKVARVPRAITPIDPRQEMSTLKRSVPPSPTCNHATKRAKQALYAVQGDVIVLVDSDEEDTSQDIATDHIDTTKPQEHAERFVNEF